MVGNAKSTSKIRNRVWAKRNHKGQDRHRLREQRKVSGSLSQGSVYLTKKVLRLKSFLKGKTGRWLRIFEVLESKLGVVISNGSIV